MKLKNTFVVFSIIKGKKFWLFMRIRIMFTSFLVISNQELHHKKKTFKDEYIEFLNAFEIEFQEQYLFEFYD